MKKYTVDEPEFNKTLIITETTDTGHADNINKAPEMAFENTLYLEKTKLDADGGDISEAVIKAADEIEDDEYPIPASGDKPRTFSGKTKKFLGNIKDWMTGVCLLGQIVNNCVTDNAKLPLSAAQGKVLMDLYNVLNTNKLSTSGGVMTGNIEMTSNILSFNGDYKIYNTGGRLSIDSADGSAICFLEGNRLWLNCAGSYAFYAQVSQDGRLIFYNHDHTPVMSIAYNGEIKVKGSIEQNATF